MTPFYTTKSIIDQHKTAAAARSERVKHNLTVTETANRMGISTAYLSDLELMRRGWSEKLARKFTKAMEAK